MAKETFKFAGVSNLNGVVKVRYTNDKNRAKVLIKNGHTEVKFVTLPFEGGQEDAVHTLLDKGFADESATSQVREAVLKEAKRLGFKV